MVWPHGGGVQVWRDYVIDGDPDSGAHEPIKSQIRDLIEEFQDRFDAGFLGTFINVGGDPDPVGGSRIWISGDVDLNPDGIGHAFADGSVVDGDGLAAYNSFTANPTITGVDWNHVSGFQLGQILEHTGTMDRYFGFNVSVIEQNSGHVEQYHLIFLPPPILSGAATVDFVAGVTIGDMLGVSSDPSFDAIALWTIGDARSAFGGPIDCSGIVSATQLRDMQDFVVISTVGAHPLTAAEMAAGYIWRTGAQPGNWNDKLPAAGTAADILGHRINLVSTLRDVFYRNNTSGGFAGTIVNSDDGSYTVSGTASIAAGKVGWFREIYATYLDGVQPNQFVLRRFGTFDQG